MIILFFLAVFADVLEKEFEGVTCGSLIKLANKANGFRLHSHEIKYGSGSGQQSVTGFPRGNDPNSYFKVDLARGEGERGATIPCNELVTLTHVKTGKRLHSHLLSR